MKDRIIEILKSESFSIINEEGQGFRVIESDDFEDVADRIIKLLNNNDKNKYFCISDRNDCEYQTIADIFQLIYKQGYKEGTVNGKLLKIKEIRSCLDLDE